MTKPRIVVIEDDDDLRTVIAMLLGGDGYDVAAFGSAREGVLAIENGRPADLIVLDLMMPEVSGFDVVNALHVDPATARIPILVVTANQITLDDRQTLEGFVSTIMEKAEFDRDRFITEVRRAMLGRPAAA